MSSQINSKGESSKYGDRLRYGKNKSGTIEGRSGASSVIKRCRRKLEECDSSYHGLMYEDEKSLRPCKRRRMLEERLSWIEEAGFSIVASSDNLLDNYIPVLYIRTSIRDAETGKWPSQWYAIPEGGSQIEPPTRRRRMDQYPPPPPRLSPVFGKLPADVLPNGLTVALLPRIYLIGGTCYGLAGPSRQVFSYDISAPHKGWEKRPNLISARTWPYAVALDGKIYVFGGMDRDLYEDGIVPYAEVYDPELDTWEALSVAGGSMMPPRVSPGRVVFMDRHGTKHILVRTNSIDSFYTYNTSANSFTLQERVPFGYYGATGAAVDDVLYIYHEDGIMAYDLSNGEWFDDPVHGLSEGIELPIYDSSHSPFLLHIGNGRLCIIYDYRDMGKVKVPQDLILTCSILRMIRRRTYSGKTTLHASLESFRRYIVPGNKLEDCLVL